MAKHHKRKAIVFVSLVGVLTLTSSLLLVLAPAPLNAGESLTLSNPTTDAGRIFGTSQPIQSGRWQSILVYSGEGEGEHFTIGVGPSRDAIAVSARWLEQARALPPAGVSEIDPHCISIRLVGPATQQQQRQLGELLAALQSRLHIDRSGVWRLQQQ